MKLRALFLGTALVVATVASVSLSAGAAPLRWHHGGWHAGWVHGWRPAVWRPGPVGLGAGAIIGGVAPAAGYGDFDGYGFSPAVVVYGPAVTYGYGYAFGYPGYGVGPWRYRYGFGPGYVLGSRCGSAPFFHVPHYGCGMGRVY